MTKLMLEAIEALRRLPAEQQDAVADAVLRLAGHRTLSPRRGRAWPKIAPTAILAASSIFAEA